MSSSFSNHYQQHFPCINSDSLCSHSKGKPNLLLTEELIPNYSQFLQNNDVIGAISICKLFLLWNKQNIFLNTTYFKLKPWLLDSCLNFMTKALSHFYLLLTQTKNPANAPPLRRKIQITANYIAFFRQPDFFSVNHLRAIVP